MQMKLIAAIERGDHDGDFKDRKPPKIIDDGLIAAKESQTGQYTDQAAKLKAYGGSEKEATVGSKLSVTMWKLSRTQC